MGIKGQTYTFVHGNIWVLDIDASDTVIGAALSQVKNWSKHVIVYASKSLSVTKHNYCIFKRCRHRACAKLGVRRKEETTQAPV